MSKRVILLVTGIVLLLSFQLSLAAVPVANIRLMGISPRDLTVDTTLHRTSTALPNVGVGSKIYFTVNVAFDTNTYSYAWTLTRPIGSSTVLSDASIKSPTMVPDLEGTYIVTVVITGAGGTSNPDTMYISAGTWVGTGVEGGMTPHWPQCGFFCHNNKVTEWQGTGHAVLFTEGINGAEGSHYGPNCIPCHTVGYDTDPAANNYGFDDVAALLSWTFPDTLMPGNFDSMVVHYPDLANLGNIQCENCHGPGSRHGGENRYNRIGVSLSTGVCAVCHDKGTNHRKPNQWKYTRHAVSYGEDADPEHMNRSSCSRCHTAQGYLTETIDGQPSAAPYKQVEGVTCAACHDPHSAENPHQVRRTQVYGVCYDCHKVRLSSRGFHHSHQSEVLEGIAGYEYPGEIYPKSAHTYATEKCVTCHMAASPADKLTKVGEHTFNVFSDNGTPDDSTDDILNDAGCQSCHGSVSLVFVRTAQAQIKAVLDSLGALLPKNSQGAVRNHLDPLLTLTEQGGAYNYYFVLNDGSMGMHNPSYAQKLLWDSIKRVAAQSHAGSIVEISDVPNDQGKQVSLLWNMFAGEDDINHPVINYGIWRRDDTSAPKALAGSVNSFTEMLGLYPQLKPGAKVSVLGTVWTFINSVPAQHHDRYGFVAPTLFDSTVVSGMYWSVFYVSGHTSDPGIFYESLPDSGYSVDNLIPAAPAGLAALIQGRNVQLSWDQSPDPDVNYFSVYRSTSSGFTPSPSNRLGYSTGTEFVDTNLVNGSYYYKLTATDFAGNTGVPSLELPINVTSVHDQDGSVPRVFALFQNYPNPFNPVTQIRFSVPKRTKVEISVYNILGQKVKTLLNEELEAGNYTSTWNGKDDKGYDVSSGIYFYKLNSQEFSATKKMLLVR